MYTSISNSHDYLTYSLSVIQLLLPPKRESRNHHLKNILNHHLTPQLNLVQTHLPGAAPASLTVSPLHLSETQREAPRKVTQVASEYVCGKRTSCRLICIFKFHETYDMTWISPRLWGIHWKPFLQILIIWPSLTTKNICNHTFYQHLHVIPHLPSWHLWNDHLLQGLELWQKRHTTFLLSNIYIIIYIYIIYMYT